MAYEKKNGKRKTLEEYGGPLNAKRVELNYNPGFASIFGPVDVDWMLTVAPVCLATSTTPEEWWVLDFARESWDDVRFTIAGAQCGGVYGLGKGRLEPCPFVRRGEGLRTRDILRRRELQLVESRNSVAQH